MKKMKYRFRILKRKIKRSLHQRKSLSLLSDHANKKLTSRMTITVLKKNQTSSEMIHLTATKTSKKKYRHLRQRRGRQRLLLKRIVIKGGTAEGLMMNPNERCA
jgi:hypothetical protein